MFFLNVPVLPPSLRPVLEVIHNYYVVSNLNGAYSAMLLMRQDLIQKFKLNDLSSSQFTNRKGLQELLDIIITKSTTTTSQDNIGTNITQFLEGKEGFFRKYLLGKRVDFSARSVIVTRSELQLNQCGLPYKIALELFEPFLLEQLYANAVDESDDVPLETTEMPVDWTSTFFQENKFLVWSFLQQICKVYSLILNRAPTLHRFGIQSFEPILIGTEAIQLHPLVCTGFNADFDGDQMAIHLPLAKTSQLEAKMLMQPSSNILSVGNGTLMLKPTQDIVMGSYYLTMMIRNKKGEIQKCFSNEEDGLKAFYHKKITIHTPILVRYKIFGLYFNTEHNKIKFLNPKDNLLFCTQTFSIYKKFINFSIVTKAYFLTNLGVFSSIKYNNLYILTDFFFETSPGRLLFSQNFKQLISLTSSL